MASISLISWPFIAPLFFMILGPARGLIWSVMIGYLFLPEDFGFDLPGLPLYDKWTAVALGGMFGAMLIRDPDRHQLKIGDPRFGLVLVGLTGLLLLSPVGTVLTNTEQLVNGPTVRSGLRPWDYMAILAEILIRLVPFFLAIHLLRDLKDQRHLLVAIVAAGLGYSLLVMFEVRMSPQLHTWVYGFFQHKWYQHVRGDGFRPVVFLRHGLWLGLFILSAIIAAIALSRSRALERHRTSLLVAGFWFFVVLVFSRNTGALMLCILFAPLALLVTPALQRRVAVVVCCLFMAYPLLSTYGLTPAERLLEIVEPISPDRAASFATRLENETAFLARANEKPVFGWGAWARNRIYNDAGRDMSIADGLWISVLGKYGWTGYIAYFGLLMSGILFLARSTRRKPLPMEISGMSVMLAANFVYLVPNSAFNPMSYMMAGAVTAYALFDRKAAAAEAGNEVAEASRDDIRYTRFPKGDVPAVSARETTVPQRPRHSFRRDVSDRLPAHRRAVGFPDRSE